MRIIADAGHASRDGLESRDTRARPPNFEQKFRSTALSKFLLSRTIALRELVFHKVVLCMNIPLVEIRRVPRRLSSRYADPPQREAAQHAPGPAAGRAECGFTFGGPERGGGKGQRASRAVYPASGRTGRLTSLAIHAAMPVSADPARGTAETLEPRAGTTTRDRSLNETQTLTMRQFI